MEATSVPIEKIEKHWPKFGYAFSATAFTLILKLSDKKELIEANPWTAVGLGATAIMGVLFARAIEYDGWRSFSLVQQGIIFLSGIIALQSILMALLLVSIHIGIGLALGGLAFVFFILTARRGVDCPEHQKSGDLNQVGEKPAQPVDTSNGHNQSPPSAEPGAGRG